MQVNMASDKKAPKQPTPTPQSPLAPRHHIRQQRWPRKKPALTSSTGTTSKGSLLTSVRELVGLIGASIGLFAALFYITGRSYYSGYFGAMNIPEYLIGFSLQEYGKVAWTPMFFYPAFMMIMGGLFWGIVYTLRDWLSSYFFRSVKKFFPTIQWPKTSIDTRLMFIIFWAGIFLIALIISVTSILTFVQKSGETDGKTAMLENATLVELVSAKPMMPESVIKQSDDLNGVHYIYKGFRLLTFNNGKYYLFKEINPLTCKPRQVYVIDADQYQQVNLGPAVSLKDLCQQSTPTQAPTQIAPPQTAAP
jgi:hypothetical protein